MNIKSLLLGSAAALAVVTGAQAADAVVAAEPEPMEYVRVCDAYGTGYFYIPGTETCLKIGGQFRYEKRWADTDQSGASFSEWSRGRIEVTAKNDSEWGTVSSWVRMQGSHSDNRGKVITVADTLSDDTVVESGFETGPNMGWFYTFGIGGLEFGYYDSQFAQFFGYGGRTDWGGDYINWDFGTRQYISYTAEFDAIKGIISIEHDRNRNFDAATTTDGKEERYMPDVVVGLSGSLGDYSAAVGGAYDESDNSFAGVGVVRGDIGMFGVTLLGLYSNSPTNTYFSYDGFSGIAGASFKVMDSVTLAADVQFWDNSDFRVIGDINWAVASGFSVLLEGSVGSFGTPGDPTIDELQTTTAMLRFQRKF